MHSLPTTLPMFEMKSNSYFSQIRLSQINIFYLFEFQQNIFVVDDAIKKSIKDATFHLEAECGCKVKEV